MSVPTTSAGTAISLAKLSASGAGWLVNTDATNYVEIGVQVSGTFYPLLRLDPGEGFPIRLAQGISPYARSHTAACVLEYAVADN